MKISMPPDVVWITQEEIAALKSYLEISLLGLAEAENKSKKKISTISDEDERQFASHEHQYLYKDAYNSTHQPYPMMQRLLTYSAIIQIYMILETRLTAFTDYIYKKSSTELKPNEIAGDKLEKARIYLTKIAKIDWPADGLYQSLKNLEILRHAITHELGRIKDGDKCDQALNGMSSLYNKQVGKIYKPGTKNYDLCISWKQCFIFLDHVDIFFCQLFSNAGVQTGVSVKSH